MPTYGQSALQAYARRFPISRGKIRVISKLWKVLSAGQYLQQTELKCGVRVLCDLRQFLQWQLFFFGDYEPDYSAFWFDRAKTASVVFDVGANVGFYSLLAAQANSGAQVHAFEPTPDIAKRLLDHSDMNNFQNIVVNQVGVGDVGGRGRLRHCQGDSGANDGMNFVVSGLSHPNDVEVEIISIDDYCRAKDIRLIDLLKIDVEGAEYDVLLGADSLLRKKAIRCLIVEFMEWASNRRGRTTDDLRSLLESHGYKLFTLSRGYLKPLGTTPDGDNVIALA